MVDAGSAIASPDTRCGGPRKIGLLGAVLSLPDRDSDAVVWARIRYCSTT